MTFEKALHRACKELGLESRIKEIKYKKDAYTYAEKIATQFGVPRNVKNSYMFLDAVDFCFFQIGDDVDFAISGYIGRNDKLKIDDAIGKALNLCELTEAYMKLEVTDD